MRIFLFDSREMWLKHIKKLDRSDLSFPLNFNETFSQVGPDRRFSLRRRWAAILNFEAKFSGLTVPSLNFSLTSVWPDRPPKKPFSWRFKSSKQAKNRSAKRNSPYTSVVANKISLDRKSQKSFKKP